MKKLLLIIIAVMCIVALMNRNTEEQPHDPRYIDRLCPKCGSQTVLDLGTTNGMHEFHCETCTVDFQIFENEDESADSCEYQE